jgi:hypothetical protein
MVNVLFISYCFGCYVQFFYVAILLFVAVFLGPELS